jgi:hypothetical protein
MSIPLTPNGGIWPSLYVHTSTTPSSIEGVTSPWVFAQNCLDFQESSHKLVLKAFLSLGFLRKTTLISENLRKNQR